MVELLLEREVAYLVVEEWEAVDMFAVVVRHPVIGVQD